MSRRGHIELEKVTMPMPFQLKERIHLKMMTMAMPQRSNATMIQVHATNTSSLTQESHFYDVRSIKPTSIIRDTLCIKWTLEALLS